MKSQVRIMLLVLLALVATGCNSRSETAAPDTRGSDEIEIRAAVKQWSDSARAKDADAFSSFYADDGVLRVEDAPDAIGKTAIRDVVRGMMQDANFSLAFTTDKVVVARSGDLAYETGTYALTMSDADKKAATERGHYLVVWQKQPNGAWKVVQDVPVSDPAQGGSN
ncbi:MAG: YybH family protein [Vitreimonas sp.]